MRDTLLFLVSSLVSEPNAVSVDEQEEEGKTTLTLHVAPEDMGKIIGKNGRIIRAVRDLVKILGAKRNTYVDVVLDEANAN